MRFWRLDIGFFRKAKTKKIAWQWGFSIDKSSCGCWIVSLGPAYITWMSSGKLGCYTNKIVHLKKKIKKPKKEAKK